MSKRITQRVNTNGFVETRTTGVPQGDRPNFDVEVVSPPSHYHQATTATVRFGNNELRLDGRQARTLSEVLSRHFEEMDRQ